MTEQLTVKKIMEAKLVEAKLDDYPVMQNMARFYVCDMSRYCGRALSILDWSVPSNGLYECNDLSCYFRIILASAQPESCLTVGASYHFNTPNAWSVLFQLGYPLRSQKPRPQ